MGERCHFVGPVAAFCLLMSSSPRVSVVVRSMNRLAALADLLDRLLAQEHDSYEVVVVEQTVDPDPAARQRAEAQWADQHVRVLHREPLGGPGARNEGVRAARGDLVVLVDDDDLPVGTDWLRKHEQPYHRDIHLVGFTGRHVFEAGEDCPYLRVARPLIRCLCMSYSPLKTPFTFARFDETVAPVGWLHGTNSSIRREVALEAGLWDTHVDTQDEHSLAFKLDEILDDEQYLAFRAEPPLIRRKKVEGGMAKRTVPVEERVRSNVEYVTKHLQRYHEDLYPRYRVLYALWCIKDTLAWIWGAERNRPQSVTANVQDSVQAVRETLQMLYRLTDRAEPNA